MMTLDLQADGLEELQAVLSELSESVQAYSAAELNSIDRLDSAATNADIIGWLHDDGRRFAELSGTQLEAVSQAGAREYQSRIDKAMEWAKRRAAKMARQTIKAAGGKGKDLKIAADLARETLHPPR